MTMIGLGLCTLLWLGNIMHLESLDMDRVKRTIIGNHPLCPRGCASCSEINRCVTCQPRLYLLLHSSTASAGGMRQKGFCVHSCPDGYYGVRYSHQYSMCQRCSVGNCDSCVGADYCTRCRPPFLAYKGDCIEECPLGLHYAAYSKDCQSSVDCAVSSWGEWGACVRRGQVCGYKYGLQSRSRKALQLPSPNGQKCPATTEARKCRLAFRNCVDLVFNKSDPSNSTYRPTKSRRRKNSRRKNRDDRRRGRHRRNRKRRRNYRDNKRNVQPRLFTNSDFQPISSYKLNKGGFVVR